MYYLLSQLPAVGGSILLQVANGTTHQLLTHHVTIDHQLISKPTNQLTAELDKNRKRLAASKIKVFLVHWYPPKSTEKLRS